MMPFNLVYVKEKLPNKKSVVSALSGGVCLWAACKGVGYAYKQYCFKRNVYRHAKFYPKADCYQSVQECNHDILQYKNIEASVAAFRAQVESSDEAARSAAVSKQVSTSMQHTLDQLPDLQRQEQTQSHIQMASYVLPIVYTVTAISRGG